MPEHGDWKIKWATTRVEAMQKQGITPRMPDITNGRHILDALLKLGPVRSSDMGGLRAADWPEIVPFAQGTGRISEPEEIELIHDMAQEYLAGHRTGCKLFGIEPMEQAEEGE